MAISTRPPVVLEPASRAFVEAPEEMTAALTEFLAPYRDGKPAR
jgi:hypothetical protein